MTFRRGACLTTAATLGYADTADLGPTAGNGFRTRWPDDLALLQDIGVTDVRVTLDWARLQPKPGALDTDWAEQFEQILQAAGAIGLCAWGCLHDGSIPRWFDNDGGFGNDETFTTWWPRWVERAADRFGDVVAGWMPFATIPVGAPAQPWIDTWGILDGGPPVVASVDLANASVHPYVGRMNLLGAVLSIDWAVDDDLGEGRLAEAADTWGGQIRDAADSVDNALIIPGFAAGHGHADTVDAIVANFCAAVDNALADGAQIDVAFIEPGIAGTDSLPGLLDADRVATDACRTFLADAPDA